MPNEAAVAEGPLLPRLLPKARYLSPEFKAQERERLWPRVWLHAAATDMLSGPGSFVTVLLAGGVDVLVLRDHEGVVRAFHNVCIHRGRRLVDATHGELQTQTLRCGLHNWQYKLDGTLANVPERRSLGTLLDDEPRLSALACETWRGQVFVHLGQPEQTLASWMAPVEEAVGHYDLQDYVLEDRKSFALLCNWKAIADLFNEAYHVAAVHPYLLGCVDDSTVVATVHGPHAQQVFTFGRPSPRVSATEVTEPLEELLRENGADPAALDGDAGRAIELIRAGLRERGVSKLSDEELTQGRSWLVFPSQTFQIYPARMQIHRHRPHPTDPEQTVLDQYTFKRPVPGVSHSKPRVSFHVRPAEGEDTGKVTEDDLREVLALQQGMRSPGFEDLRIGTRETGLLHMHAMIDRYLAPE